MKILLSLCCLWLAMLLPPTLLKSETGFKRESGPPFRIIDIRKRAIGYNYFESMAITSREDFDAFLKEISQEIYWNDKQAFVDALVNAKVDFDQEALVLLRHDEASGSVKVSFENPILQGKTLLCEIRGELFTLGTGDMAYYCFALAVSKSLVNQVQLNAATNFPEPRTRPPILLPVTGRQPLRFVPQPPPRTPPASCPTVTIECPTDIPEIGKTYLIRMRVEGLNSEDQVTYNWSVSPGEIVEGQGTRSLKVRITELSRTVTLAASLGGIDPYCNGTAICSFASAP